MSKTVLSCWCCVLLLSCAKPTDPESLTPSSGGYSVVAKLRTSGYAQDVEVKDTIAYLVQGEGPLTIVSVADPANPRILSVCQQGVRGYSYKLALSDTMVYVASGGFNVNSINVSNPYAPRWVIRAGTRATLDLEVLGGWLFLAIGESGWQVAEIFSLAGYPDVRSTVENPGYAHGMATTTDSCLLVTCGEMGLAIYDLRDIGRVEGHYPPDMTPYAWIDLPGYAVGVDTMGSRRIAFVACGTAGVQVVDFSDTSNVRVIGSYTT
ncbi:MAG: hypothetical protein AAB393_00855, partial [Bacteroidota bacterium]